MKLAIATLAIVLMLFARLAGAAPNPDRKFIYTGQAMGTVITVFLWTDDEVKAAKAAEAVFAEMKRIDGVMTTWTPDSEVSKINAAAGSYQFYCREPGHKEAGMVGTLTVQ